MTTTASAKAPGQAAAFKSTPRVEEVSQHIVEFVCDSGEGAQTAGQMLGTISAQMGNGVWTVEIIPAEIEPPNRSQAGASGNRIRIGTGPVTNTGDQADVVVAFNEQVLYSRIDVGALGPGTKIFLENKWATDAQESIRKAYAEAVADFKKRGYEVIEVPMEQDCLRFMKDPKRGKNMWALGLVCAIYDREVERVDNLIKRKFKRKGQQVIDTNLAIIRAGYEWALLNVPMRYRIPVRPTTEQMVVMNGNQAIALGAMAAGIEVCSMYPITPATSVSHHLASQLKNIGGFVHQAEDEIAAIGFALGCSYAGKTPITVSSGPGIALKTEFMALAVMAELPIVIVNVQRGGPSTGLPTRVEQGDLLAAIFGMPGDAPKIVMAPSTIEECFDFVIKAREHAEEFRGPVIVLTDANLATGQAPFARPKLQKEWLAPPIEQSPWDKNVPPFAWDPKTGLSHRPVVGQRDGQYVLTGLTHDERSRVAYESAINQRGMQARSNKLRTFQQTLKPPVVSGEPAGDMLVVGWGSTRGAIEEAVARIRKDGVKISSLHLSYLSPLQPGLTEIFKRFKRVMTVEVNFSDDYDDPGLTPESRRYAQLAYMLRATTLVDVDCWSRVPGSPLPPKTIEDALRARLGKKN